MEYPHFSTRSAVALGRDRGYGVLLEEVLLEGVLLESVFDAIEVQGSCVHSHILAASIPCSRALPRPPSFSPIAGCVSLAFSIACHQF